MHPYMIKAFTPFFREGNLLELGSYQGDFTKRFLEHFDDVTCVEASVEAIEIAKKELGDKIKFVHSLFEEAKLPESSLINRIGLLNHFNKVSCYKYNKYIRIEILIMKSTIDFSKAKSKYGKTMIKVRRKILFEIRKRIFS